jgi:hypothetical protein
LAHSSLSSTQLVVVVPAPLLNNTVIASVFVEIWDKMGDVPLFTSNSVSFSVTSSVGVTPSRHFVLTGSMTTPRSGHTATLLTNGKVLVAGGINSTAAELFDPASESFTPTGSMSTPRYGATATLLSNGKVLIAGGFGPGASVLPRLNTAELYDPFTGTFSVTGNMSVGRVRHTATLLSDGNVLIAGGTTSNVGGGAATATAEIYDSTSGIFSAAGSMISDRAQHTATLLADGSVLIVGGWNGHAADAADDPPWDPMIAELFDPLSLNFTAGASMGTTRIGHVAIPLISGKVLILGGVPTLQNVHVQLLNPPYAQLYDPVARTFSSSRNLTMPQTGYSGTLLTNGEVLLVGGGNLAQTVSTAELFDPNAWSLIPTGGLAVPRRGHSATLLHDGRVLVTGGVDSNGNALATAELYQ